MLRADSAIRLQAQFGRSFGRQTNHRRAENPARAALLDESHSAQVGPRPAVVKTHSWFRVKAVLVGAELTQGSKLSHDCAVSKIAPGIFAARDFGAKVVFSYRQQHLGSVAGSQARKIGQVNGKLHRARVWRVRVLGGSQLDICLRSLSGLGDRGPGALYVAAGKFIPAVNDHLRRIDAVLIERI